MIALDTNVLIYACDKSDPRRQQVALDLIGGCPGLDSLGSLKVVNPFE